MRPFLFVISIMLLTMATAHGSEEESYAVHSTETEVQYWILEE